MKDVLAVSLWTGKVRVMATDKDEQSAAAIIHMAVMRRGVDDEMYVPAPPGRFHDGDAWLPDPASGKDGAA